MTTDILIIILEIIIGLLSTYFIYYARQKGKNQADKNDLKKLTIIVEDVKKKNNEEIELLKANLSILSDKKIQLFSEGKEAIIVFYAQLHKWIWDGLNIHLNEYDHSNYNDLKERTIKIRDDHNHTNVTFSKVQLLVNDDDLINAGHEAIIETLKLHHFKENLMDRLLFVLSWEKTLIDEITSGKTDLKTHSELSDIYQKSAKEKEAEKKVIWDEYLAKNQDMFGAAIKKIIEFRYKAKKYLAN